MDAEARPFFQNANACNISSDGGLVWGINHQLKIGEVIGVQYGERKARFRVIWAVDSGSARKIEAGIQLLAQQQNPWHELTPPLTRREMSPDGKNKRRFVRHKILFPIEIGFPDVHRAHMQTSATDIGGRGCYVETLLPLPQGTEVIIIFWMDAEKIKTSGVVRASDPGVGMGIEFTDLENRVQERLQAMLERLDNTLFASRERDRYSAVGCSSRLLFSLFPPVSSFSDLSSLLTIRGQVIFKEGSMYRSRCIQARLRSFGQRSKTLALRMTALCKVMIFPQIVNPSLGGAIELGSPRTM